MNSVVLLRWICVTGKDKETSVELLQAIQLICIVGNLILGIVVLLTNPRRAINRQFFLLTMTIGIYLYCLRVTVTASTAAMSGSHLRLSFIFGMGVLFCFNLLRLSVVTRADSIGALLKRAKVWIGAMVGTVLIVSSPWFISGMDMPGTREGTIVPTPKPLPGFPVMGVVLVAAVVWLSVRFILDARKLTGVKRTECQYLATGAAVTVVTALLSTVLLPAVFGTYDTALLMPFSFFLMDLVVAYGIARSRILSVGEMLRSVTAYGLMTVYFVVIYSCVFFGSQLVSEFAIEIPSIVGHVAAALAVAYSFAPANGLMQRFANQLFISVQPLNIQTTMTDANRLLRSLRPLDELLSSFSQLIGKAVGSDQIRVLLLNDKREYQQFFPMLADTQNLTLGSDSILVEELSTAAAAVSVELLERRRDIDVVDEVRGAMSEADSSVAVGIRAKGRLEGMLLLGRRVSGRMYSKTDLDALQLLSDQLGVAIENAKLYSAVQQSREYSEKLVEKMVSGVIAVNGAGEVTTFNQEAQRLLGVDPGTVLGKDYHELPDEFVNLTDQVLRDGRNVRDQELILRQEGWEPVPLRVGAGSFRALESPQSGALLVFHDMSIIRRLESEVRKSDRLASIGTIAAGMAHEIKNPLVAIKTFTQLLPERYEEEEFRDTFSTLIAGEVTRIDSIVNQLLDFARPAPPILTRVHVHELLDCLVALLQHQFRKKHVQVQCDFEASDDVITADANQLEQALMNLVLNGVEAMEGGGTLTISTGLCAATQAIPADPGSLICISVQDTGGGIPADRIGQVFDPFFTTKQNGTGLGLSVTHRIVEDHGGGIEVDSETGRGTTFRMYFPLATEELARELAS